MAIACHLDMEINSIYIIREIPENRDHLENHLAGIWQQLLILYIYEDKGVAIPRGTDEEQDQFIFAGSVFEAEGQYHIFYTGYNVIIRHLENHLRF